MENYFNNNTLFYIIPEDIQYSSTFKFTESDKNSFVFKNEKASFSAKINEEIEVFSSNNKGILYFKSKVISYVNGLLTIKKPIETEILQRRENERISICEAITLTDKNSNEITAKIIDLSVGGMKISADKQLLIKEEYYSFLNLDSLNLKIKFIPLRVSYEENNFEETYTISGQIFLDSPKDKIELIQYCYKKQFEQNNRG